MLSQYRAILSCIGEDPERDGLRDTPTRAAKAMLDFTKVPPHLNKYLYSSRQ